MEAPRSGMGKKRNGGNVFQACEQQKEERTQESNEGRRSGGEAAGETELLIREMLKSEAGPEEDRGG